MTRFDKQEVYCICMVCAHHDTDSIRCQCKTGLAWGITVRGKIHERKLCPLSHGSRPCDTIKKCNNFKERKD